MTISRSAPVPLIRASSARETSVAAEPRLHRWAERALPLLAPLALLGLWQLVTLTGTDGVAVAIDDPTRYTVQFLPEGRLTAKLDCNQGSAGFTASEGVLEVSVMAATLALCEPGSHGDTFGRILQYATSYDIDADGILWLRGDEGVLQLRPAFAAVP